MLEDLTYLLTYLLTYSMVQSPSWEANWFAASQEIPRISRNPNVHYRTHKRPPPVSILVQPNPVHIHTSHLLEIHPNIIHPSTPRSPQWSLSLRFPHQDPTNYNRESVAVQTYSRAVFIKAIQNVHYSVQQRPSTAMWHYLSGPTGRTSEIFWVTSQAWPA